MRAGVREIEITAPMLFHLAPQVCINFRGLSWREPKLLTIYVLDE